MSAVDDEVTFERETGFNVLRDAPHARFLCLVNKHGQGNNQAVCPKCLCFVCELDPAKCAAAGTWAAHCDAIDSDPTWIIERRKFIRRRETQAAPSNVPRGPPGAYQMPGAPPAAMSAAAAAAVANALAAAEQQRAEREQDEHDEGVEDIFAQYVPRYVTLGSQHPDPVCETTSLAFAQLPPVTYVPKMQIKPGALSTLQAETLVYACQRFERMNADGSRAGFFLGDGVGLGKGRQLAAIIHENMLRGRTRHLWLSVSSDLITDARRDLEDIGASKIPLHALNKLAYGNLDSKKIGVTDGIIFVTYASLVAASGKNTRLEQLIKWMNGGAANSAGEGCICFDESHKAKNLVTEDSKATKTNKSSKTALSVQSLQRSLPSARVVYCSATGASSVKAMAYMERLALWGDGTSFPSFKHFAKAIDNGSHGALELVALEMKTRGSYIARQLSFHTATFQTLMVDLEPAERAMYDSASKFWRALYNAWTHARETLGVTAETKRMMSQFWGAHQRFFKQLVMSIKVRAVVAEAQKAIAQGKCVVIGLQGTGEARVTDAIAKGEDLDEFRASRTIIQHLLTRFPTQYAGADERNDGLDGDDMDDEEDTLARADAAEQRRRDAAAAAAARLVKAQPAASGGVLKRNPTQLRARASRVRSSRVNYIETDEEEEDDDFEPSFPRRAAAAAGGGGGGGAGGSGSGLGAQQRMQVNPKDSKLVAALRSLPAKRLRKLLDEIDINSRHFLEHEQLLKALDDACAEPEKAAQAQGAAADDSSKCAVCLSALEAELMLCDGLGCERAMHTFCCSPPLHAVPEGEWFCPQCSPQRPQPPAAQQERARESPRGAGQPSQAGGSASGAGSRPVPAGRAARKQVVLDDDDDESAGSDGAFSPGESEAEQAAADEEDDDDDLFPAAGNRRKAPAGKRARSGGGGARKRRGVASIVEDGSSDSLEERPRPSAARGGGGGGGRAEEAEEAEAEEDDEDAPILPRGRGGRASPATDVKIAMACGLQASLVDQLAKLDLPVLGPLDSLIQRLGGASMVAEMTGRKSRLVVGSDGRVCAEKRNAGTKVSMDDLNLSERQQFMDGAKRVAIISEAASSGISLQSDRRCPSSHMQRVHLTLELPWSSEQAIQQCGRTHRSNQVTGPHYILAMSNVAGERRFASAVAKRLQALGALTKGDRRASDAADLSAFDLDNKWGQKALETVLETICHYQSWPPSVAPPVHVVREIGIEEGAVDAWVDYLEEAEDLLASVGVTDSTAKVKSFLNRLLGLPIGTQNRIFSHFAAECDENIKLAKRRGEYGDSVVDIRGSDIKMVGQPRVMLDDGVASARTMHYVVQSDRGVSYEQACKMLDAAALENGGTQPKGNGFHISNRNAIGQQHKHYVLALQRPESATEAAYMTMRRAVFNVHRPSTGPGQPTHKTELADVYSPISRDDVKVGWERQHTSALTVCIHGPQCKNGAACTVGKRMRTMHLIGGSLLPIWSRVESVMRSMISSERKYSLKVTRIRTEDGGRLVGVMVAGAYVVKRIQDAIDGKDEKDTKPNVGNSSYAAMFGGKSPAVNGASSFANSQATVAAALAARTTSVDVKPNITSSAPTAAKSADRKVEIDLTDD